MKKLANKKIIIGCGCCIIALLGIFYFLSYKQKDKAVACSLKEEYRKKEPAIDGTPVSELIEPNAVKVYANPYTKNEWKEALVSLEHGYFEDVTMTDDGGYHKKKKPGTYQVTYQNKYCKNKQTYEYVVPEPKGVITDINLTSMEEFHLPSEILKKFKRNEYTYDQMLELVYKYNDNCRFSALIRKPDGTEDWEKIPGYIEIVFKEGEPVVHFQIPNKDFRIIKPGTSKELEQVISSVMGYTYENQSFNPTLHFPIVGDDKEDEKKKEQIKQNSCILKKDYENNEPAIDGIPVSILLDANVSKIYVSPYTEYEWKKALLDPEYGYDDVTLIDDDGYQDNPKPGTYQVTYQNKYCKNTQTFTYILPKAQGEILEIDKKIPEFHLPSKLLHKLNPDDYSDDEIKELIYKYNDYKVNVKVKKPDGSIVWEKISPVVHVFFNSGKLKVSLGLPSNSFRLIDVGASKELEDAVSSYMGYTYDDHDDDRLDFGKSFDVIAD